MKAENWKKLTNELRAENKDLKAQLEAVESSHDSNRKLRIEVGEQMQKVSNLQKELEMAERAIRDRNDEYLYVTGMLAVLKRLSRLYPEEQMTHEEYMKNERGTYREILSEVDLPF